jgi:hypothetical protein
MTDYKLRVSSTRVVPAALCGLLLWLTPASIHAAGVPQNRVTWEEFQARITPRHKIRMVLPDGSRVEGNPLAVRPDAIDMRVTGTSNKQAHPQGNTAIPRSSFSVVDVRGPRWAGKLIGTLVPVGIGAGILAAGVSSGGETEFYAGIAAGGCTMGFGAVAGFFLGRAIDRRFETLAIVPEQPREAVDRTGHPR